MNVLIVAKTKYSNGFCVGGLTLETKKNIRLLTSDGENQMSFTDFEIGQYWNIDFNPKPDCILPHSEDVIVIKQKKIGFEDNLKEYLLSNTDYWRGGRTEIFGRTISYDDKGKGFLQHGKYVPINSVGFWKLPFDISLVTDLSYGYGKTKYRYESCEESGNINLPYKGCDEPLKVIPSGTLVRMSLARWFNNAGQEKCYLQISGWYLNQHKSIKNIQMQFEGVDEDEELPF